MVGHIKYCTYIYIYIYYNGITIFVYRFEKGMYITGGTGGLMKYPLINTISDAFSIQSAINWFDITFATLDCYTMVFSAGFLSPHQIFMGRCQILSINIIIT